MLQFKTLGWQKEDETSPNNILWKRHHGVEGFSGTWPYEASTGKSYPL